MSGTVAGGYVALLRRPVLARTFGLALLGRLAYGVLPLSLLLTVQQTTGSFATAAVTTALNGLATLSMPLKARVIDRLGQRRVVPLLAGAAAVVLLGGSALAAAGIDSAPAWWALGVAIGLASPPLGPCMRAQWRRLVADDELAEAYALDAVCEETLYLIGPLISAGLLVIGPAHLGLALAGTLLVVGGIGLAASPVAAVTTAPAPRSAGGRRRGPLRHRRFRILLAVMACAGAVIATLYTTIAARALAIGHPEYAGLGDAAIAVGAVIGGLTWGWWSRHRTLPWTSALPPLLMLLVAAIAVSSLVAPFALVSLSLAVAGLTVSPVYVIAYGAGDHLVEESEVTEASTLITTTANLGISAGAAVSGVLIEHLGPRSPAYVAAPLALALATVLTLAAHAPRARREQRSQQ